MNYLQRLKTEKQAREQEEQDKLLLKELVTQINEFHSLWDGNFLQSLASFMEKYKEKQNQPIVSSKL